MHNLEAHPHLALHIPIPLLVIKEQHLLITPPQRLGDSLHMRDLVPRVDLQVIEELARWPRLCRVILAAPQGTTRVRTAAVAAGLARRRDQQHAQQLVGEVRRARAARCRDLQALGARGCQDARHVRVEGKGLAMAVACSAAARLRLQRGRAVRVDPEGPEGVVEVEDEDGRKG